MERKCDELLILRRFPGYLRLHVPPLIYDPKASLVLREALSKIEGVRRIEINKEQGKVFVHYDRLVIGENTLLLAVDGVTKDLLKPDQKDVYEKTIKDIDRARMQQIVYIAANGIIVVYLIKAHWMLIKHHWLKSPLKNWWPITTVGVIVYLHRKQLGEVLKLGQKNG